MKNIILIVLGLVVLAGAWFLIRKPSSAPSVDYTVVNNNTTTTTNDSGLTEGSISIDEPKANATTTSPITLSGRARGNWFFEASAPVSVIDVSGKTLGTGHITATGDWMTTDYVPFTGSLTYTAGTSTEGYLLFMNDNPSGDPSKSVSVRIPVHIKK